jgi:hypothetical protein
VCVRVSVCACVRACCCVVPTAEEGNVEETVGAGPNGLHRFGPSARLRRLRTAGALRGGGGDGDVGLQVGHLVLRQRPAVVADEAGRGQPVDRHLPRLAVWRLSHAVAHQFAVVVLPRVCARVCACVW